MTEQIIFSALLLITIAVFLYSAFKIYRWFKLTKPAYPVKQIGQRIKLTIVNAFFQDRIFRNKIAGFMHALVFWGFCVILIGSIEIVIDGVAGLERSLGFLGLFYDIIMGLGDISAYVIALFTLIFIIRRCCLDIPRLHGKELSPRNHKDAYLALTFIFILMISLAGVNIFYVLMHGGQADFVGRYPISEIVAPIFAGLSYDTWHIIHDINWWVHIVLIFIFANVLPYSKHFHIFMSIPNVFFSRLTPLGKLANMDNVTKEVKMMLNPETAYASAPEENQEISRFGILDAEDFTWKNYIDSLACTQCGRCTSVCPANLTGKELSPRKLFVEIRKRMKEKGPKLIKDKNFTDGKSFIRNYISEEEIWACTTCNACAKECPLNIDHPTFILDMRRYLAMEEASAPAPINAIFSNIENNGAPWQYSNEDRLKWTEI
jgi:heterodisulfide reductase subunit C